MSAARLALPMHCWEATCRCHKTEVVVYFAPVNLSPMGPDADGQHCMGGGGGAPMQHEEWSFISLGTDPRMHRCMAGELISLL